MTVAVLAANRGALWLAELGAWLHNCGKLHEKFITKGPGSYTFRNPVGRLLDVDKNRSLAREQKMFEALLPQEYLKDATISLPAPFDDRERIPYTVADLMEMTQLSAHGDPPDPRYDIDGKTVKWLGGVSSRLTYLLAICHERASNVEKDQEQGKYYSELNGYPKDPLTSVFGMKEPVGGHVELWNEFGNDSREREACFADRAKFLKAVPRAFKQWGADANWPINDVSLYDISFAVAAMFKAAVARYLIEGGAFQRVKDKDGKDSKWLGGDRENDTTYRWRVVRIAVDGPGYSDMAIRIPDVLKRRKLLDEMFDAIREHFEDDLSFANEIYRDEYGVCFLWPVLTDDPEGGLALENLLEPGLREKIRATECGCELSWKIVRGKADPRGLGLAEVLEAEEPPLAPEPAQLRTWWRGINDVVCPVCNLRPIGGVGESKDVRKARDRKVCLICEQRREERSKDWLAKPDHTIWIDEVADHHGRFALIAGHLGLKPWLGEGGYLESSLFMYSLDEKSQPEHKLASFARVFRVTRTAREFWQRVIECLKGNLLSGESRLRLKPASGHQVSGVGHAYYLQDGGLALSVVYDNNNEFVTAENLGRLSAQHRGINLKEWIKGRTFKVVEPTGYGRPNDTRDRVQITAVEELKDEFPRLIKINDDPASLLVAIPANRALEMVALIETQYQKEFGKVRNRLPLRVGVAFADAAVPLASVLETGRRMLDSEREEELWTVTETVGGEGSQTTTLEFANGCAWHVPTGVGSPNPAHRDVWYPYFQRNGDWVLAWDLKAGDQVKINPSTFDFEFLLAAGDRLEVAYDDIGQRMGVRRAFPVAIERVAEIRNCWDILEKGNDSSQLNQLYLLLRQKQEDWGFDAVPVPESCRIAWERFQNDMVQQLAWKKAGKAVDLSNADLAILKKATERNHLLEALEIHLKIQRSRTGRTKSGEQA